MDVTQLRSTLRVVGREQISSGTVNSHPFLFGLHQFITLFAIKDIDPDSLCFFPHSTRKVATKVEGKVKRKVVRKVTRDRDRDRDRIAVTPDDPPRRIPDTHLNHNNNILTNLFRRCCEDLSSSQVPAPYGAHAFQFCHTRPRPWHDSSEVWAPGDTFPNTVTRRLSFISPQEPHQSSDRVDDGLKKKGVH